MSELLRWEIGSVTITRVEEATTPVRWSRLLPDGEAVYAAHRSWLDPFLTADGEKFLLSVHSFVVETPDTLIVVDTCVGDSGEVPLPSDSTFGDRLAEALPGTLDDVDIVACTHLHWDHVGWNTVEIDGEVRPRFPNARYLASTEEFAAERRGHDADAYDRSVAPLLDAGCYDIVPSDHRIDRWVSFEPSHGHSPGHVSVRITDGAASAVITGDMVHSPLQFAHPEVGSIPDDDPEQAVATRERYIEELTGTDVLVLGSHFAPPTGGHLVSENGTVRFC